MRDLLVIPTAGLIWPHIQIFLRDDQFNNGKYQHGMLNVASVPYSAWPGGLWTFERTPGARDR